MNIKNALELLSILGVFVMIVASCMAAVDNRSANSVSSSNTYYVPDDYAQIQWAVDNASASDTIIVRDGTYIENINVNKRLTVQSENGTANCIVRAANKNDHVFVVSANYVTIRGFTITNATEFQKAGIYINSSGHSNVSDNIVSNNNFGIHLSSSSYNNSLQNNTVSNNHIIGIYLDNSSCNTITNNIANMNEQKNIVLDSGSLNTLINNTASYSGSGIYILYSSDNVLLNNTVSEDLYGIYLFSSCDNNLTGNIVSSNTGELGGITLFWNSNDNTLTSNNVSSNSQYGIYLDASYNNLIYNNYFNNTNNSFDDGTNIWNTSNTTGPNIIGGPFIGGNYWSDYTGVDNNGNGFGDTPYDIGTNKDFLPLTPEELIICDIALTTGWNLISAPLNLTTWQLGEESAVGTPLNVTPKNCLTSVYRYNSTTGSFDKCDHLDDWGWWPATGSEGFTALEPGKGYWVRAENNCNLTFTGSAPFDLDVALKQNWNLIGWYSLEAALLGQEAVVGDPPFSVTPENSLTSVYRYNSTTGSFDKCDHLDDWGWWPATGSEGFTGLEPGRGYWVRAKNACVWRHEA